MKFVGDYHLHTRVSDGHTDIADHVAVAKARGLSQIVISDHSFSTLIYHATEKKLQKQRDEISALEGCGIKIYQGIEGNLIGNEIDVPHGVIRTLDVLTVGFHRFITPTKMNGEHSFLLVNGFSGERAKSKLKDKNTEAYLSVIKKYPIDIIAHLGHRAPVDIAKVCECAKEHGVYIELNEKHLDTLEDGIDGAIESGVNFIVGTDSHKAKKTGDFTAVEQFIIKHKIPMHRVYGVDGNMPTFKDKKEWSYERDV